MIDRFDGGSWASKASLSAVLVISACAPQPEPYSPRPQVPHDLPSHMSEHFIAAMDLETAVIRGQLIEGRQYADWLAAHQLHRDLPGARGPHAAAVKLAAADAGSARDLPTLASAAARMAVACGGCHAATQNELDYLSTTPPPEAESVGERMARHVWATDRLWEALIRNSDELWESGASVLRSSGVSAREASWDTSVVAAVQPVVDEVELLAARAERASEWEERGVLVGSLLTTCSRCHGALGIDPLGMVIPGIDR